MKTRPKLQVTGRESQGLEPSGHDIKTETRMRRRRRRRWRSKSLVVRRLGLEVAVEAVHQEDITLSSRASAEAGPVRQRTTSGTRSGSKHQEEGRPSSPPGRSRVTAQEIGSPQRTHLRVRLLKVKVTSSRLQRRSQRSKTQRTNQKSSSRSSTGSSGQT